MFCNFTDKRRWI